MINHKLPAVRAGAWLAAVVLWLAGLVAPGPARAASEIMPPPVGLDKQELAYLIGQSGLNHLGDGRFVVKTTPQSSFVVQTTIDPGYQAFLNDRLARAQAPMAAMAVIDPYSGRVLALASWDRLPGQDNYAVKSAFPAASVFKIVTAAAAVDAAGLKASSKTPYNGRSTTLYKGQLKNKKTRWTRYPTLAESFAKSVNPVFGKLAQGPVGPDLLEAYAHRLGFNQALRFEFPLDQSQVEVPQADRYHLAEVGSGFNRQTTLSPLHGALIAAAVLNNGLMMEPYVVDRVTVRDGRGAGREAYRGHPEALRRVFSQDTAREMRRLMATTVSKGTVRSIFRRSRRDKVLKQLDLGGKTGSINDPSQRYRCDWFVGYARHRQTGRAIALGVLVTHDLKRRGLRAPLLARQAIREYFADAPGQAGASVKAQPKPRPARAVAKPAPAPKNDPGQRKSTSKHRR